MAFAECQQASRTDRVHSPHLPQKASRPMWARAGALCLSALIAAGCGGGEDEEDGGSGKPYRGDFVTEWERGGSDLAVTLRKEKLFEDVAEALNKSLKLPRDLPIVHLSCGEENAFYGPNVGELRARGDGAHRFSDQAPDLPGRGCASLRFAAPGCAPRRRRPRIRGLVRRRAPPPPRHSGRGCSSGRRSRRSRR